MNEVEIVVLESYKKVKENDIQGVSDTLEVQVNRESGLDSLGLVSLMIEIEEALDITLESVITEIRVSHTLQEIAGLVGRVVGEKVS